MVEPAAMGEDHAVRADGHQASLFLPHRLPGQLDDRAQIGRGAAVGGQDARGCREGPHKDRQLVPFQVQYQVHQDQGPAGAVMQRDLAEPSRPVDGNLLQIGRPAGEEVVA